MFWLKNINKKLFNSAFLSKGLKTNIFSHVAINSFSARTSPHNYPQYTILELFNLMLYLFYKDTKQPRATSWSP